MHLQANAVRPARALRAVRSEFPIDVEFILSALEAGPQPICDRQKVRRTPHRVRARLTLYSDLDASRPHVLYTRDVSDHALGFVVGRQLPLSHGGILEMTDFGGRLHRLAVTILRCRAVGDGWFEGSLRFNVKQADFAAN